LARFIRRVRPSRLVQHLEQLLHPLERRITHLAVIDDAIAVALE
jgi:hypothetical protein